jgi:hypothetical protein
VPRRNRVPDMPQAHSFYERQLELTWWFVMAQIGQGLKERYEVPKELPPKLQTLVRRLDDRDDRDALFPNVSWENDRDLFGG